MSKILNLSTVPVYDDDVVNLKDSLKIKLKEIYASMDSNGSLDVGSVKDYVNEFMGLLNSQYKNTLYQYSFLLNSFISDSPLNFLSSVFTRELARAIAEITKESKKRIYLVCYKKYTLHPEHQFSYYYKVMGYESISDSDVCSVTNKQLRERYKDDLNP